MTGDGPLQDRRRGLEEEFFARENRELLERMRQRQGEQGLRDALREASGIADETMIERFVELGLTPETVAALTLVPLVEVAWADDSLERDERAAILESARSRTASADAPTLALLENWLAQRPDPSLFEVWDEYARALGGEMDEETRRRFRDDIIEVVRRVAESAGGTLGIGRISRAERETIARIERAIS